MFRSEHEGRGAQNMAAYTQSRDNVAKKAIVAMLGMTYHNEGLRVLVYISCSDSRNRLPLSLNAKSGISLHHHLLSRGYC